MESSRLKKKKKEQKKAKIPPIFSLQNRTYLEGKGNYLMKKN